MKLRMNNKFKELADTANAYTDVSGRWVSAAGMEKFAELIVRECIETLRLVPYDSDREFGDEVIYQERLKKHFGVE